MNRSQPQDNPFEARLRKSTYTLAYWTAAWVLSTAVLAFGPKFLWNKDLTVTLLALGANLLIGVGMIVANKNHLRDLDELYQKVMLEAMGITLGVTLIVGMSYSLVAADHIVGFDAGISHLLILASFTFMTSIFFGLRRYR